MEEQHPIPQNVTGFQFKLIGDMTIRQFGYLAANAAVAYFFYLLPLPFLFKWPVIFFFALLGVGLAFIPLGGRALDRWIFNFFRAVFSPSQYLFKTTVIPSPPVNQQNNQQLPPQVEPPPQKEEDPEEKAKIVSMSAPAPSSSSTIVQEPAVSVQIPETPPIQIHEPEKEEVTPPQEEPKQTVDMTMLSEEQRIQEEFKKLIIRKTELERELFRLRKKPRPGSLVSKTTLQSPGILQVPQVPNLISGVVRDTRGNVLQDILVEVKDEKENLVRAFKTNKLGQFLAATQLENGNYILELEDPQKQRKFEPVSLVLEGKILPSLEINNLDAREELRRKVFNQ